MTANDARKRDDDLTAIRQFFRESTRQYGDCVWSLPQISKGTGIPEETLFNHDTHNGLLTELSDNGFLVSEVVYSAGSQRGSRAWSLDSSVHV